MSPRMILSYERCMHAECEQHYSNRGLLTRTVICHHPEHEGCVCVLETAPGVVCELCVKREAEGERVGAPTMKEESNV